MGHAGSPRRICWPHKTDSHAKLIFNVAFALLQTFTSASVVFTHDAGDRLYGRDDLLSPFPLLCIRPMVATVGLLHSYLHQNSLVRGSAPVLAQCNSVQLDGFLADSCRRQTQCTTCQSTKPHRACWSAGAPPSVEKAPSKAAAVASHAERRRNGVADACHVAVTDHGHRTEARADGFLQECISSTSE